MNFEHTEDRRMLADTLNRFVSEQYGIESRNKLAYGSEGHSPQLYAQFADLGTIGALFPEAEGGFGGSGFDISVVFEALGRGLVVEPLLGALVVGQALIAAGTAAQKSTLASIISGEMIAALAHDEPGSHYELSNVRTQAVKTATGWTLNGAKGVVALGEKADLLLVSARTSGAQFDQSGISLFLIDGKAAGIGKQASLRFDGGRVAELTLDQVQLSTDALLGAEGQGYALLEHIQGFALLALASESLGAMEMAKQSTLEYLQTRKQFGVAIGTFQALQHRMADVLLEVEQARSAVINAAAAIDNASGATREKALSAAKYTVGYVGTKVAQESIQLHGGIGMTWELPMAHCAKRMVMIDHQFGDEDHHLARFIAQGQLA